MLFLTLSLVINHYCSAAVTHDDDAIYMCVYVNQILDNSLWKRLMRAQVSKANVSIVTKQVHMSLPNCKQAILYATLTVFLAV